MRLFGARKPASEVVLVVDIESASVASALVALSPGKSPQLLAQRRVPLPLGRTFDAGKLFRGVERALRESLVHISLVAARLRASAQPQLGSPARAACFLAPPWAAFRSRGEGGLAWVAEPAIETLAQAEVRAFFGSLPLSFAPMGSAALGALSAVFELPAEYLLCLPGGETAELLHAESGSIRGRATLPLGSRFPLRTLVAHAGLSAHEARSALALATRAAGSSSFEEPLTVAAGEAAAQLATAVRALALAEPVREFLVLAHEPGSEWLARIFSQTPSREAAAGLFADGGAVRALSFAHLAPYVAAGPAGDLPLALEALYLGARAPGIY